MKLNFKNYCDNYAFAPQSAELSKADRKKAWGATLAASILSLGLLPAALAIANLIRFKGRVTRNPQNELSRQATSLALKALVTPEEVETLHCTQLLQELCTPTCTLERIVQILNELKEQDKLNVLNSIPKEGNRTPLQFWIDEGNLDAVKLLVKYGAAVRIEDSSFDIKRTFVFNNLSARSKSALFQAAQSGRIEIVKYLLSAGARANFAFHDQVKLHFIPVFIYSLRDSHNAPESAKDQCECLRLILKDLTKNERIHQLKIPVDNFSTGYVNALHWIERRMEDSPAKENLLKVLKGFEVKAGEVYTNEELQRPNRFTIGEIASWK